MNETEVRVIASANSWIEGSAIQQLRKTAELPGMKLAVGLPDLHPGKDSPIGAAFAVQGRIYPALVGNDIGCGIGLWRTSLTKKGNRPEKWADQLRGLEGPWSGNVDDWLAQRGIPASGHEKSLGTIGSGNHFAELQVIEQVLDPEMAAQLAIETDAVYLCVHSGSRGFGQAILRDNVAVFGNRGLPEDSEDAKAYFAQHDHAVRWASANRELIAFRIAACLRHEVIPILDVCHNSLQRSDALGQSCWLHRKGAAPSTEGLVVIPGSRGAFSFLVQPASDCETSAYSIAHGAGRKWSRHDSRGRLEKHFSARDLIRTSLGSHVICEDKDLLYEEAPQAYKNISTVIGDLVTAKLVKVIAMLRPLITYKVRR